MNRRAVAALVTGSLSVPALWTVYGAILLGVLGVGFGILAIPHTGDDQEDGRGLAVFGIILGSLGALYGVLGALGIIPTLPSSMG
ncbi:MAG TPA: DUF4190 domain-containing protein [Chloroflexia bacterium]|nr:DUF4190 domain-containing protein [Chloroflexia bacterium]